MVLEALKDVGLGYPWQRMVFGAAVAGAAVYYAQPEIVFRKDGSCRPCALTSTDSDSTRTPFFLWCLAGSTFGIFV